MNRVAKESTTGAVLYMPLRVTKESEEILKIGDAIVFQDHELATLEVIGNVLKNMLLRDPAKSELDLYKKTYYVWKTTYYFGGAGEDPSGTSGNTMRIYITDSGIHWASSYEEEDITSKIAEKMQFRRLGET